MHQFPYDLINKAGERRRRRGRKLLFDDDEKSIGLSKEHSVPILDSAVQEHFASFDLLDLGGDQDGRLNWEWAPIVDVEVGREPRAETLLEVRPSEALVDERGDAASMYCREEHMM